MLDVHNIHVAYGDIEALSGVSFSVKKGELVSIIGANGAGKTTILRSIMGLEPIRSGEILFQEQPIAPLSAHQRAQLKIRLVPERARVFPQLTVEENIRMGMYGLPRKDACAGKLRELYELFPILNERRSQFAATLSGGEQQQLAITRALISSPELLLVDEVSMGLMPKLAQQVLNVLKEFNKTQGLTILLVEQNAMASLAISDRAYVLETGEIHFSGTPQQLTQDSRVREAYLGL